MKDFHFHMTETISNIEFIYIYIKVYELNTYDQLDIFIIKILKIKNEQIKF